MKAGVYVIQHKGSGKVYVGSSQDVARRLRAHLCMLRHGRHFSTHLQAAWDLYGEEAFDMRLIEQCLVADLIVVEQRWIDYYQASEPTRGYNKSPSSASRRGVPQPASANEKVGNAHRGKKRSAEWRARISAAATIRQSDPEVRAALSARATAQFSDPAARAKLSAAAKRRYARERSPAPSATSL